MRTMVERLGHLMTLLLRAAGVFCVVCCGLFLWQLRNAARELQNTARDADAVVKETQRRVEDTSQNLNAALIQVGLATDEARRASVEQRQYWNRISRETIGLISDARTTVRQTGSDIDGVAADVHGFAGDLHGTAGDVHEVAGAAVASLKGLAPLLEQGNRALGTANTLLADPDITRSIKGLVDSSQNVAATTANVEKISEDVQKRVHQLTQPKPLAKVILAWVLDTAYKVKAFL